MTSVSVLMGVLASVGLLGIFAVTRRGTACMCFFIWFSFIIVIVMSAMLSGILLFANGENTVEVIDEQASNLKTEFGESLTLWARQPENSEKWVTMQGK